MIVADVTCANNGENAEVFAVRVVAAVRGGDVSVRLSREVRITCTGDPAGPKAGRTTGRGR
ncbi:hypothetical protein [Halorussus caseinilyticus]|uniref:Uncharacterized protein n=1 Tax=Halorussus caseinilyticus TaxID=3034025 RepID=A0ABD5WPL0_9EURY|nr:hypothetical protein [Halorussus sp. DT72]